jgi:hypothetical protein
MPTIQLESTEYVYLGIEGTVPTSAQLAFLAAGSRPTEPDWITATIIDAPTDSLWDDAVASGAQGDYFVARLIGSFGGTGTVLSIGDYQVWVRLTGGTERPVRIAPASLEIA